MKDLAIERAQLLARESVKPPPDAIDLPRDRAGGPALGPLEEHMLDEVADAVEIWRLEPGSGADPYSQGNRLEIGDFLRDDPQTVIQRGFSIEAGVFVLFRQGRVTIPF